MAKKQSIPTLTQMNKIDENNNDITSSSPVFIEDEKQSNINIEKFLSRQSTSDNAIVLIDKDIKELLEKIKYEVKMKGTNTTIKDLINNILFYFLKENYEAFKDITPVFYENVRDYLKNKKM